MSSVAAVKNMTGISRVSGFALSLSQISNPSIPGIITSSKIRAGLSAPVASENAFSAVVAILVLYCSFKTPEITAMLLGVSSTTRMSFRSEFVIQKGWPVVTFFQILEQQDRRRF